ncbi:hypothetical protein A3I53_03400 [Candidatus Curtissbacteria bacterium RIFCSPLOWO2_02_FULL_40_13b]|uniref:Uncharacterized protein n=3 Tax=Candidatus Curtissiibacteriota TaxID=1752717 RepID=A0A1F5HP18_9BACT|nr:MAG: hypothetical protein A2693_01290 [Candidatus Curtissbacteria bacterium RIFCSPHIGHO2_01_FULL_40_12]OGE03919.1 MAG: hypothetical protein A3F45_04570 [Candidatus Curtissbacteria bacterium RIFCSPHIGHO2_12_FULL_41_17]OGE05884.1 MAG: hypothetical protein A3I53_03400 [Candidatus Curtissbacteria bacterium RIFCSPLOWO2_02_FULL_40_13b]
MAIRQETEKGKSLLAFKIGGSALSPDHVITQLLKDGEFPIVIDVNPDSDKGVETSVSVFVFSHADRDALLMLIHRPRPEAIRIALSGVGDLKLEGCGFDEETAKRIEALYWQSHAQFLQAQAKDKYYSEHQEEPDKQRQVQLQTEAGESLRRSRRLLRGGLKEISEEDVRVLLEGDVNQFLAQRNVASTPI